MTADLDPWLDDGKARIVSFGSLRSCLAYWFPRYDGMDWCKSAGMSDHDVAAFYGWACLGLDDVVFSDDFGSWEGQQGAEEVFWFLREYWFRIPTAKRARARVEYIKAQRALVIIAEYLPNPPSFTEFKNGTEIPVHRINRTDPAA